VHTVKYYNTAITFQYPILVFNLEHHCYYLNTNIISLKMIRHCDNFMAK